MAITPKSPKLSTHRHRHTHTHTYTYTEEKQKLWGHSRGHSLRHCHLQSLTISLTTLRNLREREGQTQLQASSSLPKRGSKLQCLVISPGVGFYLGGLSHHTGASEGEVFTNMTHLLAQEGH